MTNEPIWKEDIERFTEDTLALWRTQYEFWKTLQAQGAPPVLVAEIAQISELFQQAHARLAEVSKYFPAEK